MPIEPVEQNEPETGPDAALVKQAASQLARHVDFQLAPTAWYFSTTQPPGAITPSRSRWSCFFASLKKVQAGRSISLSAAATGCPGAAFYLGLQQLPMTGAAVYLACLEKFKIGMDAALAFYSGVEPAPAREPQLVYARLDTIADVRPVEVVNLWVGAAGLSSLLTLANFDRDTNDNVIMPFSSGCQSIWTIPYKEKLARFPRAVAGALDPTVRKYLPPEALAFAIPANRFVEMCSNIDGSFLESRKSTANPGDATSGKN